MLGDLSRVSKIYLVTGYTDMRKNVNGLMVIIRDVYHMDPYSNSLFLFCGRRCDRISHHSFMSTFNKENPAVMRSFKIKAQ